MMHARPAPAPALASALVLAIAFGLGLAACGAPTPIPTVLPTAGMSQDAQTHLDAARAALSAHQLDEALKEAQAAVQAAATNAEAHYLLGNVYNQLGGAQTDASKRQEYLSKAVDAYLTAIKLDPNHDAAHINLATVYYQNDQFDEAQRNVEQALKISPNDATAHYVLGTIYLRRDPQQTAESLDKAQAEFEAALKSSPNLGAAYIGLANVYLLRGDFNKALENAQQGVDLTKDAPDAYAYWALAQAQCEGGNKAAGAQTIETINSLNPTDPSFIQQVQSLAERCK